jgi:hypothetical protein
MTTTTVMGGATADRQVERMGRVALAAQGVLYVVLGLIAVQVAQGDTGAEASQRGAIETIARQSYGRILLAVLVVGLGAHALWRLTLAIRGEASDDEDSQSVAKRVANLGRSAIYVGFTVAAVRILLHSGASAGGGGGGGGKTEQESTAAVLSWPGGTWIVVGVGLVVIGVGVWNARTGITRSFTDNLDLSSLDEKQRTVVEVLGSAGYLARACAFALVGWFLVTAGRQHDAGETRGLDGSLRELATTGYGPVLLFLLAVGLVLFGAYRVLDGVLRRPSEITSS